MGEGIALGGLIGGWDGIQGWIWRTGGSCADLQLVVFVPWLEWPVASRRMPAGVGDWDKAMSGREGH